MLQFCDRRHRKYRRPHENKYVKAEVRGESFDETTLSVPPQPNNCDSIDRPSTSTASLVLEYLLCPLLQPLSVNSSTKFSLNKYIGNKDKIQRLFPKKREKNGVSSPQKYWNLQSGNYLRWQKK